MTTISELLSEQMKTVFICPFGQIQLNILAEFFNTASVK